jgi:RimJ/RimL family protein N-acetyltransferase
MMRLISPINHENLRSIGVAERIGKRYERDVDIDGKPGRLYSIER